MRIQTLKDKRLAIATGLLLTLLALWLEVSGTAFTNRLVERLDFLAYDLRYQLAPPEVASEHPIAIVDIDEESLAQQGRWPWSRERISDLVVALREAGVLMVGFDMIFSEPERNPARIVAERLGDADGRLRERLAGIEEAVDGDRLLAEQLSETETVLGFIMHRQGGRSEGLLPDPVLGLAPELSRKIMVPAMGGYTGNQRDLQSAALGGGFITTLPDHDGVLRRSPLLLRHGDALFPSLALEMAKVLIFETGIALNHEKVGGGRAVDTIRLGDLTLNTDAGGQALIPYQGGRRHYPYISAFDVLKGSLSKEERAQLDKALVLVGTSAQGLDDLVTTPTTTGFPGVEVHASLLEGILAERLPHSPDWEQGLQVVLLVTAGFSLSFLMPMMGPLLLIAVALLVLLAVLVGYAGLWTYFLLDVSIALPMMLVTLLLAVNLAFGLLRENRRRLVLKSMFGQYVPPTHIDEMMREPDAYGFAGETREMTVLFSDIRGFTSLSETLDAGDLKTLLNRFFTPITRIIFDREGTIDKYVGDMVMAFWGAPLSDPHHREHAIEAAMGMLAEVDRLKPVFRQQGLPEIDIGIGLNTGLMNVGDMGSSYRRAYTVLGDAVNLGARLESITKYYGARLLVGEETRDPVQGFIFRLVDRIQVKGKEQAIRVYEPLGREGAVSDTDMVRLHRHECALAAYLDRDWDAAENLWRELAREDPSCALYGIYLERVRSLRMEDPGPNWDGTFRHTNK